jgi:hypothetical protein
MICSICFNDIRAGADWAEFDYDETEIAARIKEVKDSWTPEDETVRLVGNGGRVFWVLPEYCVQYVSGDSTSKSSRRQDNRTKIYRRLN